MKAKTITYWATTGLLSFALLSSGAMDLAGSQPLQESMARLGYPIYLMTILGFWMVAASVVLVVPRLGRLKEWAYAGIVFNMTGAFVSHLFAGDPFAQATPSLVLTGLAVASYALRPMARQVVGTVERSAVSHREPALAA